MIKLLVLIHKAAGIAAFAQVLLSALGPRTNLEHSTGWVKLFSFFWKLLFCVLKATLLFKCKCQCSLWLRS